MDSAKNINEIRLQLFEHVRGELLAMMGIDPSKMTKEEVRRELDAVADVCDAVFEIMAINIVEVKDGKIHATLDVDLS